MTWKAELLSVIKKDGNVVASVKFSDDKGVETFNQDVPAADLTPDSLAIFCERVVVQRETRDTSLAAFAGLQPGPIVLPRDKGQPLPAPI